MFQKIVLTSTLKFSNTEKFIILIIFAGVLGSCQINVEQETEKPLITKNQLTLTSDFMTPEVLWSFGRLGDVQVSPDGKKILYGVSYYSIEQNRSNRELFVMNADGSGKAQLTESPQNEFNGIWHPDGSKIAFLFFENKHLLDHLTISTKVKSILHFYIAKADPSLPSVSSGVTAVYLGYISTRLLN